MACMTSITTTSLEEPVMGSSIATKSGRGSLRQRRRHSSYNTRRWNPDQDNVQLLVDDFLAELGRRLDFLESYGQLNLDHGIEKAYSTLQAVRDSCTQISDEMMGAGRRRAKVLVETLEERYKGACATKDTLEQKAQESVRLMESMLAHFETSAYAVRDSKLATASNLIDEGWRKVDHGIERAKEVVDDGLEKVSRAKEALKIKIETAARIAREHGLIKYDDLPEPWRVNPHILQGYRFSETPMECLRSAVALSNEFFNIWSHVIGLFIVLAIAFYFYPLSSNFHLSTKSDVFVAAIFFFAASKCLVCSSVWHTMSSISNQPLMERFACVDYTGISLLVATSIITTEYTAFYCEPVSRWTYMLLTAGLGLGGTILPWHPTFNRADMAWLRVAFYVGLACTGALPVAQLLATRGSTWVMDFYAPLFKSGAVYLGGAMLYAGKVPERFMPGFFDYLGGSHNIWHVAVLGGILFHYVAMQEFFRVAFARAETHCPNF